MAPWWFSVTRSADRSPVTEHELRPAESATPEVR